MTGGTLGPYHLDRELGAGGMGKVWAARVEGRVPGLDVGAVVALKVVHPHLLETAGFFKRFLREAAIGKAVVHENVVRTFDCDSLTSDGKRADFLVMEYVEGQTLRALLGELERVPEELCRHIGRDVAKGLAAIHAAGVVHRDMKPENVIITADHHVKVMDLGVARLQDEAMRLSQTGAFVGSIHYAAPECFHEGGKNVDGRADLHALGLVLYELACGVNPYVADDVPQILKKVLHEEPRRLGDVNPQLSPFFEEVVHTLLAKDPAARFADAAALVAVLDEGEDSAWWTSRAKAIRAETKRPLRRIRIPRETAVYGREGEVALLRSHYVRATEGDGHVVVIEGEAGIGKSRLVDELIGRLQRDGEDLNFLFGSYPPGGAATAAGAFSTAFREHLGDGGSAPYLTPSPVLVPAFDALLRGEPTPTGTEPLTKDSLQTCFVHATRGLAAERTTVLLVDDLHFAADDARALFTSLAMSVPGHRILLVGTTRPGIDEKWLAGLTRLSQTSHIALPRLGPKDLVQLLQDSFRSESLASSLGAQIALKSDGNPFFAFEIIRGLREGQFITQRDDGTWISTRVIDDIKIPSSVLDLVNARVADLSEEERDLLDVAACCGFAFDPGLVGDVLGIARIPLLKRFGQIERRHRLVRASGRSYAFDHHQVQEALYGSLHEQMREVYHAALASALETRANAAETDLRSLDGALCVDLCEHFLKGSQGARALRYLDPALTHLERGYLNDAAARLTERALAVPRLLAGKERLQVLFRRATPLEMLGRHDALNAVLDEAESLADALGEPALRMRVLRARGYLHTEQLRNAEAESCLLEALALARAAGARQEEAAAEVSLGRFYAAQIRRDEGREHLTRALAISRESGNRRGEAAAELGLGNVQATHAEARPYRERALALYREVGDRHGEAMASGNMGLVFATQGRLAEATVVQERALAICRELGDRRNEAILLANLGGARLGLGDLGRAREALDAAVGLCREIGAHYPEGTALQLLAQVEEEAGDAARAQALLEESLARWRRLGHAGTVADSLLRLAAILAESGEADAASAALEEALGLARGEGLARAIAIGLGLRARLQGGDGAEAREALAAAGDWDAAYSVRFDLWKATGDRADLAAAKQGLDRRLAVNPPEFHEGMRTNIRLNREILAACKAERIA